MEKDFYRIIKNSLLKNKYELCNFEKARLYLGGKNKEDLCFYANIPMAEGVTEREIMNWLSASAITKFAKDYDRIIDDILPFYKPLK